MNVKAGESRYCRWGASSYRSSFDRKITMKQGRLAVIDGLSNQYVRGASLATHPALFNLDSQVAVVGTPSNGSGNSRHINFKDSNFKSHLSSTEDGLIKISWDEDYQIIGATVIGDCASEIITPISLAIEFKAKLQELANFYPPHPSKSEIVFTLLREIEYRMIEKNEYSI